MLRSSVEWFYTDVSVVASWFPKASIRNKEHCVAYHSSKNILQTAAEDRNQCCLFHDSKSGSSKPGNSSGCRVLKLVASGVSKLATVPSERIFKPHLWISICATQIRMHFDTLTVSSDTKSIDKHNLNVYDQITVTLGIHSFLLWQWVSICFRANKPDKTVYDSNSSYIPTCAHKLYKYVIHKLFHIFQR